MTRIAIYYRVSTDKQDFRIQELEINKFIANLSEKPESIRIWKDYGISGNKTNRPAYTQMLESGFNGDFDTLIVYKLDRFSRNASNAIQTILKLDEKGVAFISVTQPVLNLGHSNPFRRTMLCAFAEIAEIERQTIVSRVKSGLEAAKKRGVKLGRPKLESDKIERIIELRKTGKKLTEISIAVNVSLGAVHKTLKRAAL